MKPILFPAREVRTTSDFVRTGSWITGAVLLAVLCPTLLHGGAIAQGRASAAPQPIDHELASGFFAEGRELESANPWPVALYGPILFVERSSRYVVANQADSAGVLSPTEPGGVFAGTLPEDVVIANTAVDWSGERWTMLIWPLPTGYFTSRVLLGHEMFHRLAPTLGLAGANPTNEHLDSAEARLWVRLELRALARALAGTGTARRDALADALAFRWQRHAAHPGSADEERALELNEGLAEYTGVHVSLPPTGRAGWAVERIESREVQAEGGGLSRNFAYATGLAYGLLLDDVSPGWPLRADENIDLAALVARAYEIGTIDGSAAARTDVDAARSRMEAYGGARLERFERERAAERERLQEAYRARFVDGPVLILPVDEAFNYSFDPNRVFALDGVGQVLSTAMVRAEWGSLEVSGDVLMRRSGGNIVAVVVPAPANPDTRPVTGDGWTLTLRDGWEIVPGERTGDLVVNEAG